MDRPESLGESGASLWDDMTKLYEIGPHDAVILREACRAADSCDLLHGLAASAEGVELRRTLAELRAQQITVQRLLTALRIPPEVEA